MPAAKALAAPSAVGSTTALPMSLAEVKAAYQIAKTSYSNATTGGAAELREMQLKALVQFAVDGSGEPVDVANLQTLRRCLQTASQGKVSVPAASLKVLLLRVAQGITRSQKASGTVTSSSSSSSSQKALTTTGPPQAVPGLQQTSRNARQEVNSKTNPTGAAAGSGSGSTAGSGERESAADKAALSSGGSASSSSPAPRRSAGQDEAQLIHDDQIGDALSPQSLSRSAPSWLHQPISASVWHEALLRCHTAAAAIDVLQHKLKRARTSETGLPRSHARLHRLWSEVEARMKAASMAAITGMPAEKRRRVDEELLALHEEASSAEAVGLGGSSAHDSTRNLVTRIGSVLWQLQEFKSQHEVAHEARLSETRKPPEEIAPTVGDQVPEASSGAGHQGEAPLAETPNITVETVPAAVAEQVTEAVSDPPARALSLSPEGSPGETSEMPHGQTACPVEGPAAGEPTLASADRPEEPLQANAAESEVVQELVPRPQEAPSEFSALAPSPSLEELPTDASAALQPMTASSTNMFAMAEPPLASGGSPQAPPEANAEESTAEAQQAANAYSTGMLATAESPHESAESQPSPLEAHAAEPTAEALQSANACYVGMKVVAESPPASGESQQELAAINSAEFNAEASSEVSALGPSPSPEELPMETTEAVAAVESQLASGESLEAHPQAEATEASAEFNLQHEATCDHSPLQLASFEELPEEVSEPLPQPASLADMQANADFPSASNERVQASPQAEASSELLVLGPSSSHEEPPAETTDPLHAAESLAARVDSPEELAQVATDSPLATGESPEEPAQADVAEEHSEVISDSAALDATSISNGLAVDVGQASEMLHPSESAEIASGNEVIHSLEQVPQEEVTADPYEAPESWPSIDAAHMLSGPEVGQLEGQHSFGNVAESMPEEALELSQHEQEPVTLLEADLPRSVSEPPALQEQVAQSNLEGSDLKQKLANLKQRLKLAKPPKEPPPESADTSESGSAGPVADAQDGSVQSKEDVVDENAADQNACPSPLTSDISFQ